MINVRRLEERVEEGMAAATVPGASLAILDAGEVVYARGFGVGSVEQGVPVGPDTVFRIGSTTKPITCAAIMQLVESGKLELDRTVRSYIPWFRLADPGAADVVTLRHLMTHGAGLAVDAEHFGPRDPQGLETFVREIVPTFDLVAPPGTLMLYSNPGVSVAGYVAEVAAGRAFAELVRETVLEPLEMSRTTFDPTVAMTYPLAQSHDLSEDGALSVQHKFAENVGYYPAGFAFSTTLDLANFANMLIDGGSFRGRQVLSKDSVQAMMSPQRRVFLSPVSHYGLLLFVDEYKGLRRVSHAGGISTFAALFEVIPDTGSAVILLMNRVGPGFDVAGLVNGIFDELLGLPAASERTASEPNRASWPTFEGTFSSDAVGVIRIEIADQDLVADFNGRRVTLLAEADDLYAGGEGPGRVAVGFVRDDDRPVEYVSVLGMPLRRTGEGAAQEAAPVDDVACYAGTYAAQPIVVTIWVDDDGSLRAQVRGQPESVVLAPLGGRRFGSPSGVLEFAEPADGQSPLVTVAGRLKLDRTAGG
jgi:CubicO group peptidase (beta-lactamase class C family)